MNEVTRICDEVIFLDLGKIVARDTPLGLTKMITESNLILTFDGERKIVEEFLNKRGYKFFFPTLYCQYSGGRKAYSKNHFQPRRNGNLDYRYRSKKTNVGRCIFKLCQKGEKCQLRDY